MRANSLDMTNTFDVSSIQAMTTCVALLENPDAIRAKVTENPLWGMLLKQLKGMSIVINF
jgi:hypothetical protein